MCHVLSSIPARGESTSVTAQQPTKPVHASDLDHPNSTLGMSGGSEGG